jgi:hypothetical protein
MYPFLLKLLQQDKAVLNDLMDGDPWKDSPEKPKYIRIERYKYRFHRPQRGEKHPPYWDREYVGRVYPTRGLATADLVKEEFKAS